MTARELIEALSAVDPESVVTIYDGTHDCHIQGPALVDPFTVNFILGRLVIEEDLA